METNECELLERVELLPCKKVSLSSCCWKNPERLCIVAAIALCCPPIFWPAISSVQVVDNGVGTFFV